MKHGKKYQEVAKLVDRTTLLERPLNLMRQSSAISAQAAMAVTRISRSVALSYCLQVPARQSESSYSQKARSWTRQRQQALIS